MKNPIVLTLLAIQSLHSYAQQLIPSFTAPDTICVNQSYNITNTSTGTINNFFWNICSGPSSAPIQTSVHASPSYSFNLPVYMDVVKDGNNYHMFVTNNGNGTVTRLDFGTNLNNTPTAANIGYVINNIEDIHIEKEGANWYGIAVGGMGNSSVLRLNFGTSLTSVPTVTNMGNIGSLSYPHTLIMYRWGGNCYGLAINQSGHTVTRFNFGNSIANTPTGTNFGNIGNLSTPSQMALISENGNWHAFICNDGFTKSITRLDFGNNPTSTPTATNLGNPGGVLAGPRGLAIWAECGGIRGLLADNQNSKLLDMTFPAGATGSISLTPAVTQPTLNYPQTIVRFREGNDMFYYVVNVMSNSIARVKQPTCASVATSTLQNPAAVTFSATGSYTVYLNAEETTYNHVQACKKVVVVNAPVLSISGNHTICTGQSALLTASGANNYTWNTGAKSPSVLVTPPLTTVYTVDGSAGGACIAKQTVTVSVSDCVGLKERSGGPTLNVYPNPTTGAIHISTDQPIHLQILSASGAFIFEGELEAGTTANESLKDLAAGLYLLKASGEKGTSYLKLIKE